MSATKVAISLDDSLLQRLDLLVTTQSLGTRDKIIAEAVAEKIARMDKTALARECENLDPKAEQSIADEALATDADSWPTY